MLRTEWPQLTYLAFIFIGLLICANLHGKPKAEIHNFWAYLGASLPFWWLLYMGGFFTK